MGHSPWRPLEHGSSFCFSAENPYTITSKFAVTLPAIDETPTTSKARVLLSGVKMTLNNDAVNFDPSIHGFSDFDSINRVDAEQNGMTTRIAARANEIGFEKSIVLVDLSSTWSRRVI